MTWDPTFGWRRFMAAGQSMIDTNLRAMEMFGAASEVVAMRSAIIGQAMLSPMTGDYAELQRMVPEKQEAFARAGAAGAVGWRKAQAIWFAQMRQMGQLAWRNRPLAPHEMIDAGTTMTELAVDAAEAMARLGSTTLAPVHRRVTANAKRLKKSR